MNPLVSFLFILIALTALFFAGVWGIKKLDQLRMTPGLNVSAVGAFGDTGSYLSDAAITTRNRLVKVGSDSRHVAVCGATDFPLGTCEDSPSAAEQAVAVLYAGVPGTRWGVASGAVTAGTRLTPAASGALRVLPASAGTYWVCGYAPAAAADGAEFQFIALSPYQVVVT